MKRCFIALFCLLNVSLNIASGNHDPYQEFLDQHNKSVAEPIQLQSDSSDVEPGVKAILMDSLPSKLKILFEEFKKRKEFDDKVRFKGCRPVITLVGPPGTGKTSLAQVLTEELEVPFILVNCSELGTRYQNSAEENLRAKIRLARAMKEEYNAKFVGVILDEAQSLTDDSVPGKEAPGRCLGTLIDESSRSGDILFVVTANSTDRFPDMLQSRLSGHSFIIDLPEEKNKIRAAQHHFADALKDKAIQFAQVTKIAKDCKTCSYRDIQEIAEGLNTRINDKNPATAAMIKEDMKKYISDIESGGVKSYIYSGLGYGWQGTKTLVGAALVGSAYQNGGEWVTTGSKWAAKGLWSLYTGTPPTPA